MAGKSPRLRARALAEVFYKEEVSSFESKIKENEEEFESLKQKCLEQEEEIKTLKKDVENRDVRVEQLLRTNVAMKKDHEFMLSSYVEKNKKLEEKLAEGSQEKEPDKKKKKGS